MSKLGADPASGISLGDDLRLPKRHPAYRRREPQSGSCTERENLAGDVKGKAQAAPTVRPKVPMRRRGADCSVVVEKRGNARGAKGAGHRHWLGSTGNGTNLMIQWRAAALTRWHEPYESRGSRTDVCPVKASMFSRRQTCRGKSQAPVVRIAGWRETKTLKPIDEVSLRGDHESPGRNGSKRTSGLESDWT